MIRGLRTAHRRLWGALALLVPIGFGAALAARPVLPRADLGALGPALGPIPAGALRGADVLLYAVPGAAAGDELPADARLLGRAGLPIAPAELGQDDHVWAYSLAQRRVIARVPAAEWPR